ncbi:MAG: hypothetical protein HGB05_16425 [Chloroflexi bacterium]|nr:hypothetical protein [Chloroflexota bacterium]
MAFALGLVSMTVIALLSAAAVPAQQKDFQQFATQVLLTLLMPGIVGGVVAGACNARFRADPATALLIGNRAGLGAMNATWAIPILVFNFGDRFFLT